MDNSPTSRAPAHNSRKRPGAGRSSPPVNEATTRCAHYRDVRLAAPSPPGRTRGRPRRLGPVARRGRPGRRRRDDRVGHPGARVRHPDGTRCSGRCPRPRSAGTGVAIRKRRRRPGRLCRVGRFGPADHRRVRPARTLDRVPRHRDRVPVAAPWLRPGAALLPGPALARDRGGRTRLTGRLACQRLVARCFWRNRGAARPRPPLASADTPTVVAGNPGDARGVQLSCAGVGEPVSVFFAPPQGGGGTFSDTAELTLIIPGGICRLR